jgi:hypothetical protein
MNKYLKTYIRNRNISIERYNNMQIYEVDYYDPEFLRNKIIYGIFFNTPSIKYPELINKLGQKFIRYLNARDLDDKIANEGPKLDKLILYIIKNDLIFNQLEFNGLVKLIKFVDHSEDFDLLLSKVLKTPRFMDNYDFRFITFTVGKIESEFNNEENYNDLHKDFIRLYTTKHTITEPARLVNRINDLKKSMGI